MSCNYVLEHSKYGKLIRTWRVEPGERNSNWWIVDWNANSGNDRPRFWSQKPFPLRQENGDKIVSKDEYIQFQMENIELFL